MMSVHPVPEIDFGQSGSSPLPAVSPSAELLTLPARGVLAEDVTPGREAASLSRSTSNLTCIHSPHAALQNGHWSTSLLPDMRLHPIATQFPATTKTLGIYCFQDFPSESQSKFYWSCMQQRQNSSPGRKNPHDQEPFLSQFVCIAITKDTQHTQ
jgi:hypothetical protein